MYDDKKVKLVRKAITAAIGVICLTVGFACGMWFGSSNTPQQATTTVEEVSSKDESKMLTVEKVKEFLLAYYTKKDVGENQERYKEFMTEQLYSQQVKLDESPVTQAYKGYVLNQVYDKATIYIDEENHSALVEVAYTNIQTTKRNNPEAGVKMSYIKEKGQYLVNQIEPILLKKTTNNEKNTQSKTPEANTETTEQTTKAETTQQPTTATPETTEVGTVKVRGTI